MNLLYTYNFYITHLTRSPWTLFKNLDSSPIDNSSITFSDCLHLLLDLVVALTKLLWCYSSLLKIHSIWAHFLHHSPLWELSLNIFSLLDLNLLCYLVRSENPFSTQRFLFQAEEQQEQQSSFTQGKGSILNRRSPPLLTFFKTQERQKAYSQNVRPFETSFASFCGAAGHVTKDCPKSSSASTKAWASKSDQDKSTSSSTDSKKRLSSPQDFAWPKDCVEFLVWKLLLSMHLLFSNPDHLLFSWHLTPSWIWSWNPLWTLDLLFHWFCVVLSIFQHMAFCLSSSDSSMEPPIPSSCRQTRLAKSIFLLGNPRIDFFMSLCWTRVVQVVLGYHCSTTTILEWLG